MPAYRQKVFEEMPASLQPKIGKVNFLDYNSQNSSPRMEKSSLAEKG